MGSEREDSGITLNFAAVDKDLEGLTGLLGVTADRRGIEPDSPHIKKLSQRKRLNPWGFNMNNPGAIMGVNRGNKALGRANADSRGHRNRLAIDEDVDVLMRVQSCPFFAERRESNDSEPVPEVADFSGPRSRRNLKAREVSQINRLPWRLDSAAGEGVGSYESGSEKNQKHKEARSFPASRLSQVSACLRHRTSANQGHPRGRVHKRVGTIAVRDQASRLQGDLSIVSCAASIKKLPFSVNRCRPAPMPAGPTARPTVDGAVFPLACASGFLLISPSAQARLLAPHVRKSVL